MSPEDDESNFKHADQQLFRPIGIPRTHIYRIFGEKDPSMEANRYSELINQQLPKKNGLPYFDAIILGIGLDGHTASIFSSCNFLLNDTRSYAVAVHPESKQLRITLTGPVILNSTPLLVPVIGENKKAIFDDCWKPVRLPRVFRQRVLCIEQHQHRFYGYKRTVILIIE